MMEPRWNITLDARFGISSTSIMRLMDRQSQDLTFGVSVEADRRTAPRDLIPPGFSPTASWETRNGIDMLLEDGESMIYMDVSSTKTLVRIASKTIERARQVADQVRCQAVERDIDVEETEISIWNFDEGKSSRTTQGISTESWDSIEQNYPIRCRTRVETLMTADEPDLRSPRLILFHGEPGTGKSNAIRSLMKAWSSWCDSHLITDPDSMFARANYLLSVLRSADRRSPVSLDEPLRSRRWKLIVAEDADAYLRATARHDAGAALGRLLNVTDGLLGQSLPVLVLLTTNEPLTRLHPAITRPGRCLAEIEFPRFTSAEARSWLGHRSRSLPDGATLAELFELRDSAAATIKPQARVGSYL